MNIDYGIRFSDEDLEFVKQALVGTKYDQLDLETKIKVNSSDDTNTYHIYLDCINDNKSEYMIYCPDTNFTSDTFEEADYVYLHFEPRDLIKYEDRYEVAINALTDLYELIISHCRKNKHSTRYLYLGWVVMHDSK